MDILIWALTIHGIVLIVIYSDWLDVYRDWYWKKFNNTDKFHMCWDGKIRYYQFTHPPSLLSKLIGCWICVSFWCGVASYFLNFSPYKDPLTSGIAAVGLIGAFKIVTNTFKEE